MVNTRGNKRTSGNASGEGATSHPMAEPNADHQLEDNVEVFVQEADDKGPKEHLSQEESEKIIAVGNNDEITKVFVQEVDDKGPKEFLTQEEESKINENVLLMQTNNENKIESDQNISDDDQKSDEENLSEEDDNKDNVLDRDGTSYEDSGEEVDGEGVVVADEALEENPKEVEVGGGKATEVVKGDENEATAKEDKKEPKISGHQRESKAIENKRNAKAKKGEKKAKAKEDEKGADVEMKGKESNDNRNGKQVEELKNVKDSEERSEKKKVRLAMSNKVDPKNEVESSKKRMGKKRVESTGMIFMCSSKTKNDCYKYRVLGLPESKKDIVENIYTGMRLFLYDIDLKLLYGIYKATGPGGYNIEPKAFKSQFPAQVRFTVLDDCLPLPEEKFKKVIKENYFTSTKFDCQLTGDQIKKLCKLFVISSKGHIPQKLGGSHRSEKNILPSRQQRSTKRARFGEDVHPPLKDKPRYIDPLPHKCARKAVVGSPLGYAYEQTTSDVDGHRPIPYPYRIARELPTPTVIRRDTYVDGWDSYYREGLAPYADRRAPPSYTSRQDPYGESGLRGSYREGPDPYLEPYAQHSYGRALPLSDSRDGYMGVHQPLSLEDRYRPHIGGRPPLLYDDPTYSVSRAGMSREYHL